MSYPDLPVTVKSMLANEQVRTHHHLWHFVRNRENWEGLPATAQVQLGAGGWAAPRFEGNPGSGIDFLGMHREMIHMTNVAMAHAGDSNWPKVLGWDPIPWRDDDSDWPVPTWQQTPPSWASQEQWDRFTAIAVRARSAERIEEMKEVAATVRDPQRLRQMTLDQLGTDVEWSIHGWMHIRWSGSPHPDGFSTDVSNDWLFVPWSSHVNKHFWKVHGWIDECITAWEAATGQTANFSDAWSGPPGTLPSMRHSADVKLLSHIPRREDVPLPMQVKQHIVEGLLRD